jgi:hypothetical protein
MKQGIYFKPNSGMSSGAERGPGWYFPKVCGIEVIYKPESKYRIADARGFGKRAHIVVGVAFPRLQPRVQQAILHHEAGHILKRHREMRVLATAAMLAPLAFLPVPVLLPALAAASIYFLVERLAQKQEVDADLFAVKQGYGPELLGFVQMVGPPPNVPFFYPDYERRCAELVRAMGEMK